MIATEIQWSPEHGKNLKRLRMKKNYSQGKLCYDARIPSIKILSQIESGTAPKKERLENIAKVLDVGIDELMTPVFDTDDAGFEAVPFKKKKKKKLKRRHTSDKYRSPVVKNAKTAYSPASAGQILQGEDIPDTVTDKDTVIPFVNKKEHEENAFNAELAKENISLSSNIEEADVQDTDTETVLTEKAANDEEEYLRTVLGILMAEDDTENTESLEEDNVENTESSEKECDNTDTSTSFVTVEDNSGFETVQSGSDNATGTNSMYTVDALYTEKDYTTDSSVSAEAAAESIANSIDKGDTEMESYSTAAVVEEETGTETAEESTFLLFDGEAEDRHRNKTTGKFPGESLGERLENARNRKGISRNRVVDTYDIGVGMETLRRYEKNIRLCPEDTLRVLANIYECDIEDIASSEDIENIREYYSRPKVMTAINTTRMQKKNRAEGKVKTKPRKKKQPVPAKEEKIVKDVMDTGVMNTNAVPNIPEYAGITEKSKVTAAASSVSEETKAVAQFMCSERAKKRITAADAASAAGMTEESYRQFEEGNTDIGISQFAALCKLFMLEPYIVIQETFRHSWCTFYSKVPKDIFSVIGMCMIHKIEYEANIDNSIVKMYGDRDHIQEIIKNLTISGTFIN